MSGKDAHVLLGGISEITIAGITPARYVPRLVQYTPSPFAFPLMSNFGKRLREARDAKGWTQEQLAERLKLAQAFISQLENGRRRPTPMLVKRIAATLEVEPDLLLSDEEQADVKVALIHRKLQSLSAESLDKIEDYVNLVRLKEKGR